MSAPSCWAAETTRRIAVYLFERGRKEENRYIHLGGLDYSGAGGIVGLGGTRVNRLELTLTDPDDTRDPANMPHGSLRTVLHPLYRSEAGFDAIDTGLTGAFSDITLILGREIDNRFGVHPSALARIHLPKRGDKGYDEFAMDRLQDRYALDLFLILRDHLEGK